MITKYITHPLSHTFTYIFFFLIQNYIYYLIIMKMSKKFVVKYGGSIFVGGHLA